ncbi:conserved hypothetical protein [Leishmania major strain Friedlin]|uniref:Uncharacterized protein n=1 Tax=Leishmania major TaxID=5664 RepID=Q4QAV5_LEIMA|nr:conserved hypothetical protein [Leishmania major strain Friedlin]CAG9574492.1 hypothetical_protein_-_conserved [Leishmania major strain Friedlin]CAJ04060.1 conserved hypothetical protein [Leishmania major strain Friedlin]|eukprot:XP_001683543.1 conserved hypothetical protein [Leishmania major strain Friedlin]
MTTDASPVNPYLLFSRADEFSTDAKIDYALRHNHLYTSRGDSATFAPTPLNTELDRRTLVRTLEELKRGVSLGDRLLPVTPSTCTTHNTTASAFSSPEDTASPQFDAPNDGDASNVFFDGIDDLDTKPWDTAASSQANYWNWQMEVLYQSYHIWIALDYGRGVFSITRNGVVLVDRMPTIVASILQVVETTLHAREQDLQQLRSFVEGAIADEQTRSRVMQQVWSPTVFVSVVLLNVPHEVEKAVPFSRPTSSEAEAARSGVHRQRQRHQPSIIMYPPEYRRFTPLENDDSEHSRCSAVTVLFHCDARKLLNDGTFLDRLRDLLSRYESVYRERSTPEKWPQSSLGASLEYLVCAMPEKTPECNTLILVSKVGAKASSEAFNFLQSTVRRKNLIVSIVALNRLLAFDSPELSPLVRFLSSVGGFAAHVDYWLALAAPRLNNEWCRKFEGARCLAQQIFVHLIKGFPVTIPGAARRDLLADAVGEPVVLYDGDHDLPDFVIGASTKELLRASAALRFNQGWSVLIDYRDESATSHMAARYDHDFHRGTITLHYEMNINRPAVYRRLLVSGTKALVDRFCKTRWDDETTNWVGEDSGHWLAYLSLLRLRVIMWMKAEQTLMQLLNAGPRQTPMNAIPDLAHLSSAEGMLSQWFNVSTVYSLGVFFRFEQLPPSMLVSYTRAQVANGAPTEAAARACIRTAMERRHRLVGREEDLTYMHTETVTTPSFAGAANAARDVFSLVQFFPQYETSSGSDFGLAGAFECRVSCVLCDRATQEALICALLSDIEEAVSERNKATARRDRHLLVRTSHHTENEQALRLVKTSLSTRRMRLLTSYVEGKWHPGADAGSAVKKEKGMFKLGFPLLFRIPLLSFPWPLLNALCFRWILGCSEFYPFLAEEIFSHIVSRRLHAGFVLIVYYTSSLKAVLMKRVGDPETHSHVCLFDVLEAIPSPTSTSVPAAPISLRRFVTPFKRAQSSQWTYTHDIEEDMHIATAVFTCKVIATQQPSKRSLLARQMRERGFSPIVARVESILFSLHVRYTEYVELRSPPSLGVKGCVQLRERLLNIVSCVGDRSAVVKARMLQADYVQRLSSGADVVDPDTDVYVSVLCPMRYKTALCVLILESDTEAGTGRHVVKVALAALDGQLLEYAIAQQYHHSRPTLPGGDTAAASCSEECAAASPSHSAMPECIADRAVVLSLRHLLTVFTSVYCARELISFIKRASAEMAAPAVAELTDAYAHLGNYAVEMDVTHLLNIVQWRCCAAAGGLPWRSKVQEVLTGVLASQQRSFSAHPTLWLPKTRADRALPRDEMSCGGASSPYEAADDEDVPEYDGANDGLSATRANATSEDGANKGKSAHPDLLPVAVKACVLLPLSTSGVGIEEKAECRWLSSAFNSCDERRQNTLRERSEWAIPSASLKDSTATVSSSSEAVYAAVERLKLRLFVKTVPADLLSLCEDESFYPPQTAVRRTLRLLYYRFTSEEAPAAVGGPSMSQAASFVTAPSYLGAADEAATTELDELFAQPMAVAWDRQRCHDAFHSCTDRGSLPIRVGQVMQQIAERLKWRVAVYCLQNACYCTSFRQLKARVDAEPATQTAIPGVTTDGAAAVAAGERRDDKARETRLRDPVLSHNESVRATGLTENAELHALLCDVVTPALLSSHRFVCDTFPVEFTQQKTNVGRVVPEEAIKDVFRHCVDEDWMWVLPTLPLTYVVVPNREHFGERWVLVCATTKPSQGVSGARVLLYDAQGTPAALETMRSYSSHLRTHMCNKIKQVSQLHLLKQLRESFNASAELIPPAWGDQFSQSSGAPGCSGSAYHGSPPLDSQDAYADGSPFYLSGRNVLEIPIYYKLQHQCKKILHRIQGHCSRLELVAIFNRDQCFLAADDVEGDTFHYLRLVFVKDTAHTVSVTSRPPPLTSSDRCPQLVVQLFSATPNASVQRPLQRLQDFCYFLAVQELQGHLNYVQHKMISFNDLVFLQNQRLEPIVVNLRTIFDIALSDSDHDAPRESSRDVGTCQERQREIAIALLFLNLREYKFKPFGVQDEPTHATSNFVEHYNLEKSLNLEPAKDAAPRPNCGSQALQAWRFVKIVDGLTDVLVSCCLHVHPDNPHVIVLDRYLTRIPAERYINGDSENTILAHLGHSVEKTISQLRFFGLTSPGHPSFPLLRSSVHTTVGELLRISQETSSKDSSLLRYRHFSLDNVNLAVLPMLMDRICGALSHYGPTCFTYTAGRAAKGVVHVPNFSWKWMESIQNDAMADLLELYVTCGYDVMDSPEATAPLAPTRVVPYVVPGVPITSVTIEESQMSLLGEYQLCERGCPLLEYRIVLSVSLTEGLSLALFNLRDTEYVVRLLGYVVLAMEEKSALLEDVLLQRMGYAVPSFFSEADLARNCCGDDTNVIRTKSLSISFDAYRRRVNNVRFRPQPDAERDAPLVVILEGLYNRGLIVNYAFSLEDAVKVLFDECPQYSLQECVRVVDALLEAHVLCDYPSSVLKPQISVLASLPHNEQLRSDARNCRLSEVSGVPEDALVACVYHRHILASHIIVEAQNARSGVTEVLAKCDMLWRAGPQNNVLELAKAIVTLQLKSKEVFGTRVPDFSLRRERWRHEDDVLDPILPTQTQQNMSYARPVDASLQLYTEHLHQLYPSMCIIDLDPNDPLTTSDEVLLNRLRCRYGKVTSEDGGVVLFSPHLYYGVIPFVDLLRCGTFYERYGPLADALGEEAIVSPITTSGLFIIEVGFQVVHYALDFFVINGDAVPPGITAKVAADFKQTLLFESVLYDAAVRSLAHCMRTHSVALSGQQKTYMAVKNLVKYHPFPPMHCANIVAAYTITDPRVMRLKNLTPGGAANSGDVHVGTDGVLYLSPHKHHLLQREQTNDVYMYDGLIIWERAQLFVLLTSTTGVSKASPESNRYLSQLALSARHLLLNQLLDSTQQERLDVAWRKFLTDGRVAATTARRGNMERELPSYDEFELLRGHSHKIVLHSYVPMLQMILEPVEWSGDGWRLQAVCAQLYPEHVLRVIGRQRSARDSPETSASTPHARHYDLNTSSPAGAALPRHAAAASIAAGPIGGYDITRLFMSPCLTGWFVVTFAPSKAEESGCFLAMECFSDPHRPFGASVVVEELSLYCKPSRALHQHRVMTFLSEMEQALVERFVRLVNSAVWSSIVPCVSQFMM